MIENRTNINNTWARILDLQMAGIEIFRIPFVSDAEAV